MPEDVLFKFEQELSRDEIAAYLRAAADNLEQGDDITLSAGSDSVTMSPPANPTFEIKAEHEYSDESDPGEFSIEFELEWKKGADTDDSADGSLQIE
ncbi:uncharacterized protein Nmag_0265 [Natrialba magadii ATCC 43099]|uniref:Amphi-Trp domain-containing protein n=1 Tax=Natrialba magadii (strain ATCC 43099 / DSM 3394 / CCM 3739 / CIP 104546 / IAM 13178 / JCM 8861 / NBRC 102185 / NCIMB 2190 / MS3) TaxID=547559 RepID=D3SX37_NATMM|nr:amphi-Trp domain-containing protein [Natrialba magadii]ADD03857.1 uncharacterized protein Nmag_0265 [Natrialba magadii ATCC 43099]ELY33516.1 hypothetical protein C500_01750 [Natrialba magadii ATCC 43099]